MYKMIGVDGRPYGPVSPEQIRQWIREGRARSETLIQPEGGQEWKALNQFPEFAEDLKAAPPAPVTPGIPPSPVIASKASNKIAAGICGILLGPFGVHKFILGYTNAGIIM